MKKNVLALSIAAMIGGLGHHRPLAIAPAVDFGRANYGATRVRFRGASNEGEIFNWADCLQPIPYFKSDAAIVGSACCDLPNLCASTTAA